MKGKNFGPLLLCIAIVLLVLNILLLSSVSSLERDLRSMESGMQSRISELRNDNVRLQQSLNSLEENFRASAADVVDVSLRYTGVTEADEVRTALGFTLKESRGGQVLVTAISDTREISAAAEGAGLRRSCELLLPMDENYILRVTEKTEDGERILQSDELRCDVAERMASRTYMTTASMGTTPSGLSGDMEVRNETFGAEQLRVESAWLELYLDGELRYTEKLENRMFPGAAEDRVKAAAGEAVDFAGSPVGEIPLDSEGVEELHYAWTVSLEQLGVEEYELGMFTTLLRIQFRNGDSVTVG